MNATRARRQNREFANLDMRLSPIPLSSRRHHRNTIKAAMGPNHFACCRSATIVTKSVENSGRHASKVTRNPIKPDGLVSDCG
jgi:hypothetical protein